MRSEGVVRARCVTGKTDMSSKRDSRVRHGLALAAEALLQAMGEVALDERCTDAEDTALGAFALQLRELQGRFGLSAFECVVGCGRVLPGGAEERRAWTPVVDGVRTTRWTCPECLGRAALLRAAGDR